VVSPQQMVAILVETRPIGDKAGVDTRFWFTAQRPFVLKSVLR